MPDPQPPAAGEPGGDADFGHPRGTLAIVLTFAVLFALGWAAMYFMRFLAGGGPQP